MFKPIIKPLIKPVQKLTTAFRRQSLLERRQKQVETLIQQRQMKGLPTKAEEVHKENIRKELESAKAELGREIGRLDRKSKP